MSARARRALRSSRGMSLVELMVALTIGAILLGGALTLFINNRDTYNVTNDLSRLQETARFALGMMLRDIRMAGHFGCAQDRDNLVENIGDPPTALWNPTWPIEGLEAAAEAGGTNTFEPSGLVVTVGNNGAAGEILSGRDAITVRYIAGNMNDTTANTIPDYRVTADVSNGANAVITVDTAADFSENDVIGISDCGSAEIFRVNAAPTATTLTANNLTRSYTASSTPMVGPYVGVRYYIGDNGRGPGGQVYPSLFRATVAWDTGGGALVEQRDELFEGVEFMNLLFGVDTDNDGAPNQYVRANDPPLDVATNWARVVSVRIGLLVRTVDEYGRDVDTNVYAVNNVNVDPVDDRRRRRVFTTTAMVRNLQ